MIVSISLLFPQSPARSLGWLAGGQAFQARPPGLCPSPPGTGLPLRRFASLFVTRFMATSFLMVSVISSCQGGCVFGYLGLGGPKQLGWFLIKSSAPSQGLAVIKLDVCLSL